jgi:O-acetyl-ADP-ribose deacetylase (regulator of RNase III)
VSSGRIEVVEADLLSAPVDALVNAANEHLEHGGGIAAAIARAAGPELERESRAIGLVPTGQAVATTAGRLPQRYVLHTPGPVWRGGLAGEAELLAACHRAVIALAAELQCRSVALPAISTGIYGYPLELAAPVALRSTREALDEHPGVELVQFCLRGQAALSAYSDALAEQSGEPGPA